MTEGEFFILILSARGEPCLTVEDYFDPDPYESEAIRARREEYCRLFEIPRGDGGAFDCFHSNDSFAPPVKPDLVHRRLAFRCNAPRRGMAHYHDVPFHDFADPGNWYQVVSLEWRRAVESVEPGKHEFFPVDILFLDETVHRFIFRDRQNIPLFPARRMPDAAPHHHSHHHFYGRRSMLAGRHWIRNGRFRGPIVSRDLAERLRPLIGEHATLTPIRLVD